VDVTKANGTKEAFSVDKIITSLMNAGVNFIDASRIASEIRKEVSAGITSAEIRNKVSERLGKLDASLAENYNWRAELFVRTSRNTLEPFDAEKIAESLMNETLLDRVHALAVAREVEKELGRTRVGYVTAPLIREIVNVKLLERGLENARARYTRLGMPVHDVKKLLSEGTGGGDGRLYNPETVHKLMGDQISREYTLLSILPPELADAHMSGVIHIHDLEYFPIRPYCMSHDLRFFLREGIKPDGVGSHTAAAKAPKNPEVAFLHAAKVLASAQTNCAGGQTLSYLNVYLAPFVRGLDFERVKQLAQMLVFELAQMYGTRGGQVVYSCLECAPTIPSFLAGVDAVQPGGMVEEGKTYASYGNEAHTILSALADVFAAGDARGNSFAFPKLSVHVGKEGFDSMDDEISQKLFSLSRSRGAPYFIAERDFMGEYRSHMAASFSIPDFAKLTLNPASDFVRGGGMQVVTVNLPRLGLEAAGGEEKIFELLTERLWRARQTLILKKQLMEGNLERGLLPFLSQPVSEGQGYFVSEQQNLLVGFVGLNELVKCVTGDFLHESDDARKFGLKFLGRMKNVLEGFCIDSGLHFVLARSPSLKSAGRLASIDSRVFRGRFSECCPSGAYTNSFFVPDGVASIEDRLRVESPFHELCLGGALSVFDVGGRDAGALRDFASEVVSGSKLQLFRFKLPAK